MASSKALGSYGSSVFDKIPPLTRRDGSTTKDKTEQAEELLSAFFAPLSSKIEDEGPRPQRTAVSMPPLTIEVGWITFAVKSEMAPGDDGLPALTWKQVWAVAKDRVWPEIASALTRDCTTAKIRSLGGGARDE